MIGTGYDGHEGVGPITRTGLRWSHGSDRVWEGAFWDRLGRGWKAEIVG